MYYRAEEESEDILTLIQRRKTWTWAVHAKQEADNGQTIRVMEGSMQVAQEGRAGAEIDKTTYFPFKDTKGIRNRQRHDMMSGGDMGKLLSCSAMILADSDDDDDDGDDDDDDDDDVDDDCLFIC